CYSVSNAAIRDPPLGSDVGTTFRFFGATFVAQKVDEQLYGGGDVNKFANEAYSTEDPMLAAYVDATGLICFRRSFTERLPVIGIQVADASTLEIRLSNHVQISVMFRDDVISSNSQRAKDEDEEISFRELEKTRRLND
ncbi:hypothetical protein FOZ63_001046, partial [Perkinsus olseni]